ncbi:MAG: hypothetical protein M1815_002516 [Lichina confinis]|nr:MAG: hypothetical protein M1815_002516 [Lichina confinis]
MAQEQIAIASAVVIPEDPVPDPTHKRAPTPESRAHLKRRRLGGVGDDDARTDDADSTTNDGSLERRHDLRAGGRAEERNRGKRLFGALLGTLSQSSSSAAQKRRADIERKQQTKLKQQAADYDAKKREDLDRLLARRRREQERFDEQSYYKPWKLSPSQEERIRDQVDDAEMRVRNERGDSEGDHHHKTKLHESSDEPGKEQKDQSHVTDAPAEAPDITTTDAADHRTKPAEEAPRVGDADNSNPEAATVANGGSESLPGHSGEQHKSADSGDSDGGEVVLEADEDTVIY